MVQFGEWGSARGRRELTMYFVQRDLDAVYVIRNWN